MFLQANSSLGLGKSRKSRCDGPSCRKRDARAKLLSGANLRPRPFIRRKVVPRKKVTLADENNVDPAGRAKGPVI